MEWTWQRIAVVIGIVIAVAVVAVTIAMVFFRRAPEPEVAPPELVPINVPPVNAPGVGVIPVPPGLPTPGAPVNAPPTPPVPSPIAQGGRAEVRPVTERAVAFATFTNAGELRYYDPSSGQFFRIGADGKPVALSDRAFPNVQSVTWAPNSTQAILEFPDGANVTFDFATNRQTTLPKHWEAFAFAPTGDRIVGKSMGLDRDNRWLFESDTDGNGFRPIEPLGENGRSVTVAWSPNNQVVAFSRTGRALGGGRQQILLVGRNGENFPGLTVEGQDFRPLWSPTGGRILYSAVSAANDYKPELWVVNGNGDAAGTNRQRLRVDTWADKCTFASEAAVYCAVPTSLERGYGLEPRLAATTPDVIERIDLTTGIRTTVGRPANDASITKITLAPDGGTLYFSSANDSRVYAMQLK